SGAYSQNADHPSWSARHLCSSLGCRRHVRSAAGLLRHVGPWLTPHVRFTRFTRLTWFTPLSPCFRGSVIGVIRLENDDAGPHHEAPVQPAGSTVADAMSKRYRRST